MIDIDDVKTVKLGEGQMLAVKVDLALTPLQRSYLYEQFEKHPLLKGKVMILEHGMSLTVIDAKAA